MLCSEARCNDFFNVLMKLHDNLFDFLLDNFYIREDNIYIFVDTV